MEMDFKRAASTFSALAQESRLKIVAALAGAGSGGLPAGIIALNTDIAPSSTSFHLKELSRAQLVTRKQDGRMVIYSLAPDPLEHAAELLRLTGGSETPGGIMLAR